MWTTRSKKAIVQAAAVIGRNRNAATPITSAIRQHSRSISLTSNTQQSYVRLPLRLETTSITFQSMHVASFRNNSKAPLIRISKPVPIITNYLASPFKFTARNFWRPSDEEMDQSQQRAALISPTSSYADFQKLKEKRQQTNVSPDEAKQANDELKAYLDKKDLNAASSVFKKMTDNNIALNLPTPQDYTDLIKLFASHEDPEAAKVLILPNQPKRFTISRQSFQVYWEMKDRKDIFDNVPKQAMKEAFLDMFRVCDKLGDYDEGHSMYNELQVQLASRRVDFLTNDEEKELNKILENLAGAFFYTLQQPLDLSILTEEERKQLYQAREEMKNQPELPLPDDMDRWLSEEDTDAVAEQVQAHIIELLKQRGINVNPDEEIDLQLYFNDEERLNIQMEATTALLARLEQNRKMGKEVPGWQQIAAQNEAAQGTTSPVGTTAATTTTTTNTATTTPMSQAPKQQQQQQQQSEQRVAQEQGIPEKRTRRSPSTAANKKQELYRPEPDEPPKRRGRKPKQQQ